MVIVTIDGPAGSGKSTVARKLAEALRLPYIDTGAMYRTVAWLALQEGLDLEDEASLTAIAQEVDFDFRFEGGNFQIFYMRAGSSKLELGKEIRSPEISMAASQIARYAELRKALVAVQQKIGNRQGGVLEGRDAGTVIFPKADAKFFLTASSETRASRRHQELVRRMGDEAPSYENVLNDVIRRDQQDGGRVASPMKPAEDAEVVDTTGLDEKAVFDSLLKRVRDRASKSLSQA